ncbi:unnamed protein product [Prorocentrum cordatum]|uniref:Uncharacterized protein n=1 Tax=Prorocentrum cordatum TaxID=2364126 RepID=A0ABN9TAV9_9DINO|nr:unnamed protein product [Polarella glacialis]
MSAARAAFLSLAAFNPFSLTGTRGEEVSAQLRQIQIVGCPGTQIPKHPRSPHHAQRHGRHFAIYFGYGRRSMHINNSAGRIILLNHRFKEKHIKDITARRQSSQWRDTMTKVAQWVKQEILNTPSRFTPIVMMDLNDRFAAGPDGDETVGQFPTGKEGEVGKLYHHTLANSYMAVANTYYGTGPTYDGRHPSVTDYIYIPAGLVSRATQRRAWNHAAHALQISRKFKDHKPLVIKLEAPPACRHSVSKAPQTMDRDAIALGLKEGRKRKEFLESLDHNLSTHAGLLDEYLAQKDGTYHWDPAMQCFRDAALEHFAVAYRRIDWYREAREHKLQLLKERAQLRQRLHAHEDHPDVNEDHLRQLDDTIYDLSKKLRRHQKHTNHKHQAIQCDDLWQAWRTRRLPECHCANRNMLRHKLRARKRFHGILPSSRPSMHNRVSMQANTSQSFQPDKGKMILRHAGLRLIHWFDVFWRCFYRHLRERGCPTRPPDYAYGGIPHRRREFGMIVTRVVSSKLRRAKIAFAARPHDGRNAFGFTHHDAITGRVIPTSRDGDRQLALRRRTVSQTIVDASDGTPIMRNREGGLMGCPSEPDAFMKVYNHQLEQ